MGSRIDSALRNPQAAAVAIAAAVVGVLWATAKHVNYLASDPKPQFPKYKRPW
jgi:hypothetical protein